MLKVTLDHSVIHVGDWDIATAFYRDVLKAEVVPYGKGAMFRFGSAQLNTHGPDQIGSPRAKLPVMPGGSDLCFEWHGTVEEAQEHLQSYGVKVEVGPVKRKGAKGDGISLYFRDPDGSLLEFIIYHK